jgi:hypothetical protein
MPESAYVPRASETVHPLTMTTSANGATTHFKPLAMRRIRRWREQKPMPIRT